MSRIKLTIKLIALLTILTSIIVCLIINRILLDIFLEQISLITLLVWIEYKLFENFLWKKPFLRQILSSSPIIEGKWIGTAHNDSDQEAHQLHFEIRQTWNTVTITSCSERARASSIYAKIFSTGECNDCFKLIFTWEADTIKGNHFHDTAHIYGTTILKIQENGRKLSGSYFTDALPSPTRGSIHLTKINSTESS